MAAIQNVIVYRPWVAWPASVIGSVGKKPGGCSLPGCWGYAGAPAPAQAATMAAMATNRAKLLARANIDGFRAPIKGTGSPGGVSAQKSLGRVCLGRSHNRT